ncbi:MAG: hypothetical protein II040_01025 [Muribaculaceae bacterium]|jgi:hypothetical protein|nr:hypothetical protein [Muribaculaceae bacterium]
MKKTVFVGLVATSLLMSSCQSMSQFYGATTGASLGGMFGSAIGGIADGPRGSDLGTVVGMAIGGMIGAAATAPKTDDGNYRSSDYYYDYDMDDYRQNNAYSPYANIEIEELRFVDENNNRALDADEHAKLVFIMRNTGRDYIYDIAPVITVSGTKQIYLSPTAIVKELAPGKAVRYQSEIVATKKLKNGVADFSIGLTDGDKLYTLRSFQLRTYKR